MPTALQLVTEALRQRGFTYVYSAAGYSYEGSATICGQAVRLRIHIEDDTFVDLPLVQLLERPERMPTIVPHVSPDGHICYAARGTLALDIFDPAGQTLACIDRALEVVERAIQGELDADLAEEFFAYWPNNIALADVPLSKAGTGRAFLCQKNSQAAPPLLVLTDDIARTRTKLPDIFLNLFTEICDIQIFRAARSPGVRQYNWPPKTVGSFLSWQGECDAACARRIKNSLHDMMRKKLKYAVSLIQSPTSWYGIFTMFSPPPPGGTLAERLNKNPTLLRSVIWPLSITRIDDDYLASRNVPGRVTLTGLRIALVGCGTIGGYLADLLVRAGAGLKGGELALIDPEVFVPGNLGRHRLGLHAMFQTKAPAVAEDLKRIIPSVQVTTYPLDVRKVAGLERFDLIVDATGEEALSNYLNVKFHGERFVPMVFTWISGAGESVHALIRDTKESACYQCLARVQKGRSDQAVLPALAGYGCESLYVPFPASTSVSAAALALDAILDWANGQASPKYRERILAVKSGYRSNNNNTEKAQDCPACAL